MNSHILPGARSSSGSTGTRSPRRALAVAALLAAATVAPAVGAADAAGSPPSRPSMAPAGAPASATSRRSLMPENLMPALALVDVDLCATTGTAQIPRASGPPTVDAVPIWSYIAGDCSTGSGTAALGGAPVIEATVGDTVTVTLHNDLPVPTSLTFQGQTMPTDRTGAGSPGGTKSYTIDASRPGTFLYEAGFAGNTASQVAMGLHGVLVVHPATADQAYNSASTAFDESAVVLISEIDPALNANPTGFDMRNFAPKWTAINGKVLSPTSSLATVAPGEALLLRYVNAGSNYHSMSLLGGNQRIIADDGNPLTHDYSVVAQTVGPGQTTDAIIDVSTAATDGSTLAVFDANLQFRNRNRRPSATGTFRTYGGAIAFVSVSATPSGTDTVGPVSSGASADAVTGDVIATVSDVTTGGSNVDAAEYSLDTLAAAGTGSTMTADSGFDTATEAVSATIPPGTLAALTTGVHTVYVRGHDEAGNWGAATATSFSIDRSGPLSSGLSLTPNPNPGTGSVALHATGSDATTGGATVAGAEYFIDAPVVDGLGTAMAVNNPLVTASLDASINAVTIGALADGDHTVRVHARDSLGNWGPPVTGTLVVDRGGPVTSGGAASPNPTNGLIGVNSSTAAVRVTASATDTSGGVVRAEGFFDTVGAPGTGFPMFPADGAWGSATEALTVDVPLTTIRTLGDGAHTIHLRARDAAGNWGATFPVALLVDKAAPVQTGLAVSTGANTASVSVNVTDGTGSGVQRVEFYVDTDPGKGAGTAMALQAGTTYGASIPVAVLAEGNHTVVVRSRDAAGTWSANASTTLNVVRTVYFSTLGNTNPPTVAGTADDADLYLWNGAFSRAVDVTAVPVAIPAGANVDGLVRTSNTDFYVSFAGNVTLTGVGPVQDEDIVRYNGGTWSVYFDGTAAGLTLAEQDIDAFDIVGSTIFFSTVGNVNPPTVTGTADDADVYSWDGSVFSRVLDVTTVGVPAAANVDGLAVVDATHLYLSFAGNATVPGPGAVQDEDVIYRDGSVWRAWFDGTAKGLTAANHDLDAIDVP